MAKGKPRMSAEDKIIKKMIDAYKFNADYCESESMRRFFLGRVSALKEKGNNIKLGDKNER